MEYRPSVSAYLEDMTADRVEHALTRSRQDTEALLTDSMMKLKWYHPFLTRHAAECMLIDNAPEGSYLLRPSTSGNIHEYALSAKFSKSVQHIKITRLVDGKYQFGQSVFDNADTLRRHFEIEKPVIGGENNVTVLLKYPYSREIDEQHLYTDLHHHAVTNMIDLNGSDSDSVDSEELENSWDKCDTLRRLPYITPVSSREGYLTKRGRIRKSWKIRWFVLRNNNLAYYKTKQSKKPLGIINMMIATSVDYDHSTNKDYCFRIVLPHRTFLIYANSDEDCEQWLTLLQSKIFGNKRSSQINGREAGAVGYQTAQNNRRSFDPINTPEEQPHTHNRTTPTVTPTTNGVELESL